MTPRRARSRERLTLGRHVVAEALARRHGAGGPMRSSAEARSPRKLRLRECHREAARKTKSGVLQRAAERVLAALRREQECRARRRGSRKGPSFVRPARLSGRLRTCGPLTNSSSQRQSSPTSLTTSTRTSRAQPVGSRRSAAGCRAPRSSNSPAEITPVSPRRHSHRDALAVGLEAAEVNSPNACEIRAGGANPTPVCSLLVADCGLAQRSDPGRRRALCAVPTGPFAAVPSSPGAVANLGRPER